MTEEINADIVLLPMRENVIVSIATNGQTDAFTIKSREGLFHGPSGFTHPKGEWVINFTIGHLIRKLTFGEHVG